jgi:Flp pilus assembly pilin Flp
VSTRSSPFIDHSEGAPNIERAMLSVVIVIAIVSLLVSLEALLSGTTADENRKCAGSRARTTSAASGRSSARVSGTSRQGRHAIAVAETGALPLAPLALARPDHGDTPRLALPQDGDEGSAPRERRRRDGDWRIGLDQTGGKSWATFTTIFVPYSAPAGAPA